MCFFRLPGQNSTAAWQTAVLPTDRDDWHSAETASHKDSAHTKPADRCCTTGHWFHGQSPENQTQWHKNKIGGVILCKQHCKETIEVQQDQCLSQNRIWNWFSPFDSGKVHSQGKIRTYQFPEKQPLWKRNSFSGKSAYSPRRSHTAADQHFRISAFGGKFHFDLQLHFGQVLWLPVSDTSHSEWQSFWASENPDGFPGKSKAVPL